MKNQFKRARIVTIASITAMVMLASTACSAGESIDGDAVNDELVVGVAADALTLDPSADNSPVGVTYFRNIFSALTNLSAQGKVIPDLATSWTPSEDAQEWTFKIRTDAKFQDDSPVAVDDIIWSIQMILDNEKSPMRPSLSTIESMDRVSNDEIRFHLNKSFAAFPAQVSLASIIPQKVYEEVGPEAFSREPVGSGPYKVIEWVKDDHIKLEAWDDYWGDEKPTVKSVLVKPVPSESARSAGLETGELDIVAALSPSSLDRLKSAKGVQIKTAPTNKVLHIGFNIQNPVLSQKLREAVDYGIDRDAITKNLLDDLGVPLGQVVAPVVVGFDGKFSTTKYDPEKAKQLVKESGYDGTPIPFQYANNQYPFADQVSQAIAGYMSEIGINIDLQGAEYSAYYPMWAGRQLLAMYTFMYGPSTMDAELPLDSLFRTGTRGYIERDDLNALVAAQRAEADPAKRQDLISQVWKINKEEAYYVVLYNEVQAYGVSDSVDWEPRADGLVKYVEVKGVK